MKALVVLGLLLATSACGERAESPTHQTPWIVVSDAWASPTPGGVDVSAGYLTISNNGDIDDRLLGASSARAVRVEIHEMIMDGGVMSMRQLQGLDVPAHGQVTLAPGGTHLMFLGVTEPFREDEAIEVELQFEYAGDVGVALPVRRRAQ
jgi:hypothetical protein